MIDLWYEIKYYFEVCNGYTMNLICIIMDLFSSGRFNIALDNHEWILYLSDQKMNLIRKSLELHIITYIDFLEDPVVFDEVANGSQIFRLSIMTQHGNDEIRSETWDEEVFRSESQIIYSKIDSFGSVFNLYINTWSRHSLVIHDDIHIMKILVIMKTAKLADVYVQRWIHN